MGGGPEARTRDVYRGPRWRGNGPEAERFRGRRHPKMLLAAWLITQRKAAAAREVGSTQGITGATTPIERRRPCQGDLALVAGEAAL